MAVRGVTTTDVTTRPVQALVLAGGRSRRLGRDKAGLEIGGKPQLERVVELLTPLVDKVWVSVRADQPPDALRDRYPQIVDRETDAGPVGGILAALESDRNTDWLVVAVDLPRLDRETVEVLLSAEPSGPFTAYRSASDGLPEPLCAVYRAQALPVVRRYVDTGVRCPRKILIKSGVELLTQPNPVALDNLNTPEDQARIVPA